MGMIEYRKDGTPLSPCDKCGYIPTVDKCPICGEVYDVAFDRKCGHDVDDDLDDANLRMHGE
jgi:rubrerythrin